MAQATINESPIPEQGRGWAGLSAARLNPLWLGLGLLLTLFAVGGRWDLPLAAWLAPIFLLRFSRVSRPLAAVGALWAVCVAAALFWTWQLKVPVNPVVFGANVLFGTVYSLPYLLDRLVTPRFRSGRLAIAGALLLLPAARAASEFAMGVFSPMGTAYGLTAVTQHANLPLMQVISLAGPYAIGFLVYALATVVNGLWAAPGDRRARLALAAYVALLLAVAGGGAARLAFFPQSTAATVRIAGLSPSMAAIAAQQPLLPGPGQSDRAVQSGDKAALRAAFARGNDELLAQTHRAAQAGARIVFWSENSALLLEPDAPAFLARAAALARAEGVYLNVADKVFTAAAPYGRDETHLIGPDGRVLWTYRKAHPIPGLEGYIPGDGRVPVVQTPFGRLANVICYDADFPAMMRADADIMLVPGGDWPEMGRVHTLHMASLRAIEQGHALVRQDFNGLSAAFDYQGHILAQQDTTGQDQHLMLVNVPTHGVATLYRLTGDLFAWACVAAVLALVGLGLARRR